MEDVNRIHDDFDWAYLEFTVGLRGEIGSKLVQNSIPNVVTTSKRLSREKIGSQWKTFDLKL